MTNKKGFTLVEMLIVIVIIGILTAALIPRLGAVKDKASDAGRKTAIAQAATAIQIYGQDNDAYPSTPGSFDAISGELKAWALEIIPVDTKWFNPCDINNDTTRGTWYGYLPVSKITAGDNKAFVIFTCPKSAGSANWISCGGNGLGNGEITTGMLSSDIKNYMCTQVTQGSSCIVTGGNCTYTTWTTLRLITVYP